MTTGRRNGPKRLRKWVELRDVNGNVVAGGQSNATLLNAGTEHVKSTLIHMQFQITMYAPSGETAGDIARLEYGIVTVNEDAGLAAAFPDPL